MIANNYQLRRLSKLLKTGRAWIEGRTTDGDRWPDPNHYWIITDSTTQETWHVLVTDRPSWARYAPKC